MSSTVHQPIFRPFEFVIDIERRAAWVAIPNVLESRGSPIISPATGGEHRVRTKAALAAAKAKGVKLGGDRGNLAAKNAAKKAKANEAAAKVVDIIRPLREQGASLQAIADRLTAMGVGSNW